MQYFVEKIEDATLPDLPLDELARSNDPEGLAARRLQLLTSREPQPDYQRLIREARVALERQRANPAFATLPDSTAPLQDEEIHAILEKAALALLSQLAAQREQKEAVS